MAKKNDTKDNVTAARLRALRAEHGKTQQEISQLLNVSQQTYSNYEKGTSHMDSPAIIKMCQEFNVSADYLLGIESGKKDTEQSMSRQEFDKYIADFMMNYKSDK